MPKTKNKERNAGIYYAVMVDKLSKASQARIYGVTIQTITNAIESHSKYESANVALACRQMFFKDMVEFGTDSEKLSIPIELLGMSARTTHCMEQQNLVTLGDIVSLTESKLLRIPNMGRKCVNEVIEIVSSYGLKLQQ